jgi:hypothetical protein
MSAATITPISAHALRSKRSFSLLARPGYAGIGGVLGKCVGLEGVAPMVLVVVFVDPCGTLPVVCGAVMFAQRWEREGYDAGIAVSGAIL